MRPIFDDDDPLLLSGLFIGLFNYAAAAEVAIGFPTALGGNRSSISLLFRGL